MERNQGTLQEAIEKTVDLHLVLKNQTDDIIRKSPHCKSKQQSSSHNALPILQVKYSVKQNKWNITDEIKPMINSNLDSTAIPETDYATVLSKDQMDWLIVGGSYLFFAIIW